MEQSKELNPKEKILVTWLRKNQDNLPKDTTPAVTPTEPTPAPAAVPVKATR